MTADTLLSVLGWSCAINYAILLIWALFFMLASDWMYRFHGRWFSLSKEEFHSTHYSMMGYFKLLIIVFNLAPYLALRIVG